MEELSKDNIEKKDKKRALGRGLAALLGEDALDSGSPNDFKEEALVEFSDKEELKEILSNKEETKFENKVEISETKNDEELSISNIFFEVKIDKVFANKNQPRKIFNTAQLEELANSIKEQGLIQPVVVSSLGGQNYQIVAGERRWRASKLAGLLKIPVVLRQSEDFEDKDNELASIIENVQRVDLNPIEEAEAYNRILKNHSFTQEELSKKLGISRVSLSNTLRLRNLPDPVKKLISSSVISEGHGRALLALSSLSDMQKFADEIVENTWSVRETERRVKATKASPQSSYSRGASFLGSKSSETIGEVGLRGKDKEIAPIEDELRQLFGTKVILRGSTKGGIIELYYSNEDSLHRIIHQLRNNSKDS